MTQKKTSRTEGIFLRVRKDIRSDIQRKMNLNFNLSEEFERWYSSTYMVKETLEDRKHQLESALKLTSKSLEEINKKEKQEQLLSLNPYEISRLKELVESFKKPTDQFLAFKRVTGKKINQKNFKLIKVKYIE